MSTTETPPATLRISGTSTSLRILAGAVVLLFFYYAAGVVITLLLSVLLAYFLDPAVELLERFRVPRTIGALMMVLLLIAVIGVMGYGLWIRSSDFADNWPSYRGIIRDASGAVQGKLNGIEGGVNDLTNPNATAKPVAPRPIRALSTSSSFAASVRCMPWSWKAPLFLSWFSSCSPESAKPGTPLCNCSPFPAAHK